MKITILGSGGSAVSARRACPSIIIDESLVFDLGPGSLRNLRVSGIVSDHVTDVFISHIHADHISDLMPFLWMIQIDGRQKPLRVHGPPGFKGILQKLMECTSTPSDFFKFPLNVSELQSGQVTGNVGTCRTRHSIPTMSFRVRSDSRSFCYTADTTYSPELVEFARDVDLLLHEATFLQDQLAIAHATYHSTPEMAGRAGREARAKRLMIFHIPPPNEHREEEFRREAMEAYGEEVVIATDLTTIEL